MPTPDLSAWGIDSAVATAGRPPHGTNNDVWLIDTPTDRFVWRSYTNLSISRVIAEHALLAWLGDRELPFETPTPLPTTTGATFTVSPDGRAVALHRLLPGNRANDSAIETELVATAFARLCATLADAPASLAPIDWTNTRLTAIHDGIGDANELLTEIRKHSSGDIGWLTDTLNGQEDVLAAVRTLPRQIVHGDVAASNALLDGARVTGLIDFEIAGLDARVSDVGTALLTLGGEPSSASGRARIRMIRNTFDRVLHLSQDEVEILPEVVRHRLAGSVLWRAGRWRNGDAELDEVTEHVTDGAQGARWLDAYRR